jgi:SAM-dependent methyltransferase
MLWQMSRARRFNRWMADSIAPYISGDVLEIGAGIGNLTEMLYPASRRYIATDTEEEHVKELRTRFPRVEVIRCDAAAAGECEPLAGRFDTVVCLNVLEHIEDERATLKNLFSFLKPRGKAIVLVPQGAQAFGSLDEVLLHKRRYSEQQLGGQMMNAGFRLEKIAGFNRATYPGWLFNSRILRRRTLSNVQLRLFDLTVPIWRRVDRFLPWPPTSLIAIGVREH